MARIHNITVALENADYGYMAFTFNGRHSISDFGVYRVSDGNDGYQDNLNLETRDQNAMHAGMLGQMIQIGTYKPRIFNINIAFENMTEAKLADFKKWLITEEEEELWFSETPYKVYRARVQGTPTITVIPFSTSTGGVYKGTGKITFVCSNPYAYAPSSYTKNRATAALKDAANYNDFKDFYAENSKGTVPMPFVAKLNNPYTTLTLITGLDQSVQSDKKIYGQSVTIPRLPDYNGCIFAGWNTEIDGSGQTYAEGQVINDDLTLYAQWNKFYLFLDNISYWDINGEYELSNPTNGSQKFMGWFSESDGKGSRYSGTINLNKENLHLYSYWNYVIRYKKINGVNSNANETGHVVQGNNSNYYLSIKLDNNQLLLGGPFSEYTNESTNGYKETYVKPNASIEIHLRSKGYTGTGYENYIYYDGTEVVDRGNNITWTSTVTANLQIDLTWAQTTEEVLLIGEVTEDVWNCVIESFT